MFYELQDIEFKDKKWSRGGFEPLTSRVRF